MMQKEFLEFVMNEKIVHSQDVLTNVEKERKERKKGCM
jgi:hypothetical protein